MIAPSVVVGAKEMHALVSVVGSEKLDINAIKPVVGRSDLGIDFVRNDQVTIAVDAETLRSRDNFAADSVLRPHLPGRSM